MPTSIDSEAAMCESVPVRDTIKRSSGPCDTDHQQQQPPPKKNRGFDITTPVYAYYWSNYEERVEREYIDCDGVVKHFCDRNLVVLIYGLAADGTSVCVRVTDVYRRFLIEFPDSIDIEGKYRSAAIDGIRRHIFKAADRKHLTIRRYKPLYGTIQSKPMLEVSVSSNIAAMSIGKKVRTGELKQSFPFLSSDQKLYVHELDATPELQVMTTRNVPSVGWLACSPDAKRVLPQMQISHCDVEIICPVLQLRAVEQTTCIVPSYTIAAWDCEAHVVDISSPGQNDEDSIFQISIVTNRGDRKLLTLGSPLFDRDDTSMVGVDVIQYETERDLLIGFGTELWKLRPNIVTGWNVSGFDWEILGKRASSLMCLDSALKFTWNKDRPVELKCKDMCTAATGYKKTTYPLAEGVLSLDMLYVIKDNIKMSKYSLEAVGMALLDEGKDDVDIGELFRCYRAIRDKSTSTADRSLLAKVGKYCVKDSELVIRIEAKQQAVLSLFEFSAVVSTPPQLVHTCGQQVRFFNKTYWECRKRGIAVQSDHGGEYAGQPLTGGLVYDPVPGMYDFVVSVDFGGMYPSIIQANNIDFSTVLEATAPTEHPPEDFVPVEWEDHIGCEHDPLIGEATQIARDLEDHTSGRVNLTQAELFTLTQRKGVLNKRIATRKTKKLCCVRKFKIFQKERGILPIIVENLLSARRDTRAEMKTVVNDPVKLNILNQRQLAYKVAANSMYGAMGVDEGRLKCKHAAMCVTAKGRESVQRAAKVMKELGTEQVYGDTDSVYGRFPQFDGIACRKEKARAVWDYAVKVAALTTAQFDKPMTVDFEDKVYDNFLILSKKRYIYTTVDRDGNGSDKLGNRGVLLTRRDYGQFTKRCYESMIRLAFSGGSLEDARLFLAERFIELFCRYVPVEDLCISKSVNPLIGGDEPRRGVSKARRGADQDKYSLYGYTLRNASPPAHLTAIERRLFFESQLPPQMQLALRMQARGYQIPDGNRIEYCVVKRPSYQCKTMAMQIEDVRYIKKHSGDIKINYEHAMNATRISHTELAEAVWKVHRPLDVVYRQFEHKERVLSQLKSLWEPRILLT